jgi:hypothetical protein
MADYDDDYDAIDEEIYEDVLDDEESSGTEDEEEEDEGELEDPNNVSALSAPDEDKLEKTVKSMKKSTIIDVDDSTMKTPAILTAFEIQALINNRTVDIEKGSPSTLTAEEIKSLPDDKTLTIAVEEFKLRKFPILLLRERIDGVIERINVNKMKYRAKVPFKA